MIDIATNRFCRMLHAMRGEERLVRRRPCEIMQGDRINQAGYPALVEAVYWTGYTWRIDLRWDGVDTFLFYPDSCRVLRYE